MADRSPDLYELLGVDADASDAQIRGAYRQLARRWHPDHNDDPQAPQRFAQIAAAYAVLSDVNKRADYDANRSVLAPGMIAKQAADMTIEDVLGGLFAKPPADERPRKARRWPWSRRPAVDDRSPAGD